MKSIKDFIPSEQRPIYEPPSENTGRVTFTQISDYKEHIKKYPYSGLAAAPEQMSRN